MSLCRIFRSLCRMIVILVLLCPSNAQETTSPINENTVAPMPPTPRTVTVVRQGLPVQGVAVSMYSADFRPLDQTVISDDNGKASFAISNPHDSSVRFHATDADRDYWSPLTSTNCLLPLGIAPPDPELPGPMMLDTWPIAGFTNKNNFAVAIHVVEQGNGINPESISLQVDGQPVVHSFIRGIIGYIPPDVWTEGAHAFKVQVSDNANNSKVWEWSSFVDTIAPVIGVILPFPRGETTEKKPTFSMAFTGEGAPVTVDKIRVSLNDDDITGLSVVTATHCAYTPENNLADGIHSFSVEIPDAAGNIRKETAWVDIVYPPILGDDDGQIFDYAFDLMGDESIITLSGKHFRLSSNVTIGNKKADIFYRGKRKIYVKVPLFDEPGMKDITISNGEMTFIIPDGFEILPAFNIIMNELPTEEPRRVAADVMLSGTVTGGKGPYTVTGIATQEQNKGREIVMHGEEATNGVFSGTIPLFSGLNFIIITVTDRYGNSATRRGWINKDDVAPPALSTQGRTRLQAFPGSNHVILTWGKSTARDTDYYEIILEPNIDEPLIVRGEGDFLSGVITKLIPDVEYRAFITAVDVQKNRAKSETVLFKTKVE